MAPPDISFEKLYFWISLFENVLFAVWVTKIAPRNTVVN